MPRDDDEGQDDNKGAEIIDLQITRLQMTMMTMKLGERMSPTGTVIIHCLNLSMKKNQSNGLEVTACQSEAAFC